MAAPFVNNISSQELQPLFDAVRESLRQYFSTGKVVYPLLSNPHMDGACGIFVAFRDGNGKVRGSMGFLDTDRPLSSSAVDCAIAAATDDPRYDKISANDIGNIQIEMTLIERVDEIICNANTAQQPFTPGRHGFYVERKMNNGVLLPKEIYDLKLDFSRALKRAKLKSGISAGDEAGVRCYMFSARVFIQKSHSGAVSELGRNDNVQNKKAGGRKSILDNIIGDTL